MKKPTEDQLGELLKLFTESLKEGKGFLLEQIPQVFQEIIFWGRAWYTLGAFFWLLVSLVLFFCARKAWKVCKTKEAYYRDPWEILTGLLHGASLLPLIGVSVCLRWAIMAWVSPRLYLLSEVAVFFKNH